MVWQQSQQSIIFSLVQFLQMRGSHQYKFHPIFLIRTYINLHFPATIPLWNILPSEIVTCNYLYHISNCTQIIIIYCKQLINKLLINTLLINVTLSYSLPCTYSSFQKLYRITLADILVWRTGKYIECALFIIHVIINIAGIH